MWVREGKEMGRERQAREEDESRGEEDGNGGGNREQRNE